ncbi:transmembrane protein 132E isoform X1 [Neodiprion virginianus]|uniref:transmembrane protein 132E isoform X1 n=1 Tax=Neodiprion fabricii TaxID=2872261 RepID=UPI001ED8D080|nr:transmembrane protein 132E isoform X1 [Neodiprion fabricii]XP_046614417.1 transmembrane protein 132E isoform X1 [Neodiprion virginianus]
MPASSSPNSYRDAAGLMDVWILFLAIAGVAASVEVHFENKDGGFFLKHTPRQSYPAQPDSIPVPPILAPGPAPPGSILSIDTFTVFQTSEPASVRATYGPFSTKQTVPARYIVPDPLDALPGPEMRRNLTSTTALLDAQELSARHLDMSAHLVRPSVPRDSPVLRVLFHAGSEAGGRRQVLLARHQRVCVVLHASLAGRTPLTAACSPDGEDGVCLAQITIPAAWWAPLPPPDASGRVKVAKTLPRLVQVAYSVLEPRTESDGGCQPRVQIQPVTPLGQVPLAPNRAAYKELRADDALTLLVPHAPLYPRSRLHVPAFLHPRQGAFVAAVIIRARVKSGVRILGATSSSPDWTVTVEVNGKYTAATFTAIRKENAPRPQNMSAEEILTMLLEASEEGAGGSRDGGRVVWSVRYELEGEDEDGSPSGSSQHHHNIDRRKLQARLEIQKDDIQAVLPISKNWEVMNTAVLTGRQVSQAMKVFIVSQAGKVADVTLQSSCHSEDESVLKVSSSCSSVYVDGSEIRGSSNASVLVKYGTYTGLARFTVWMPEFPLEVTVTDSRLSQVKGWKVPDELSSSKNKRSLNDTEDEELERSKRSPSADERFRGDRWSDSGTGAEDRTASCRLRFQQSPVEVHARFLAADHDSGRVSYFVNRRTWLRVTDLVVGLLRVSDHRFATLQGRIVQGRSFGRTEVQVVSPITGRVIGAKEVKVVSDRVSVAHLSVRVVSGLQLTISPDTAIENGYIAETSVTRRLTAQYQEGLLDIDIEFSDGSHTPLREVTVNDYHLLVESLDPEVVAFAPMVASHHPRVIAVGEGRGHLLRVTLQLADICRLPNRRSKNSPRPPVAPLATAAAHVEVDFASSDLPNRPEFVQNDGGGMVGSHRERKNGKEMAPDLHDILIGVPMKDENNHEPTVQAHQARQAQQHHTAIANGMSSGGMGGVGIRHHGGPHMTPLEIGMYVLLAAFCFAIVVFVVSCVVYASKFKPQPPDYPLPTIPVLGAARAAASQLAPNRRPRESTTNAHDWVWLGRATLERAACAPQQVRVTSNPLAAEPEEESGELGTSFDNPNHIELPSVRPSAPVPIDTTTYCKKDKTPRHSSNKSSMQPKPSSTQIDNNDLPPPLPPHGIPPPVSSDNANGNNDDYKPPVPPHRNTGVIARFPDTPKKHHHRASSGSHGNHRHSKHHSKSHKQHQEQNGKTGDNETRENNAEEEFVELRNHEDKRGVKDKLKEVKRATIVGNPMYSSQEQEEMALDDLNLGMDYDQIMQYFDNLKESNA